MLVDRANVSVGLPHHFGRMDIKDLLESDSNRRKPDRRPSTLYDKTSSPHHPQPIHPPPNFPLPGSVGHPILPSPAPTVLSHGDSYFRRQSTPYAVKYEPHDTHQPYPYPPIAYPGYDYHGYPHPPPGYSPNKRSSSVDEHSSKRQKRGKGPNQKWDAEEDARIIELRGSGMKWGEISKELPGRTEIACRLHYQNYLEKRGQWDEESKTKLARVYDRMKAEIWQPVASELGVPWRSCEAMHWIMGDKDMARRANTTPFTLVAGATVAGPQGEGNGRIAQANRMQESTLYFEENDLAVLQSPASANPTSAGPGGGSETRLSVDERKGSERERASFASSSGIAPTTLPVNGNGHGQPQPLPSSQAQGPAYSDISSPSPTSSVPQPAQRTSPPDPNNDHGAGEERWRLPGVNALNTGMPAYPPHSPSQLQHSQSFYQQPRYEPGPPSSQQQQQQPPPHQLLQPPQSQPHTQHHNPPQPQPHSDPASHSHSAHTSNGSNSPTDDGSERLRALATASESREKVSSHLTPAQKDSDGDSKKGASSVTASEGDGDGEEKGEAEGEGGGEEEYVRVKRTRSGDRKAAAAGEI